MSDNYRYLSEFQTRQLDRMNKEILGYHAIIGDLRDEIARLRGALKYYAEFTDDGDYARRALKGEELTDDKHD